MADNNNDNNQKKIIMVVGICFMIFFFIIILTFIGSTEIGRTMLPIIILFLLIIAAPITIVIYSQRNKISSNDSSSNQNEPFNKTYFKAVGDFNFLKVYGEIIIRKSFKGEIFREKIVNIKSYYAQGENVVVVVSSDSLSSNKTLEYFFPVILYDQFLKILPNLKGYSIQNTVTNTKPIIDNVINPIPTPHNPSLHDHEKGFVEQKETTKTYDEMKKEIDEHLLEEKESTKKIENQALLLSELSNKFMKGEISMEEYVKERNRLMEEK